MTDESAALLVAYLNEMAGHFSDEDVAGRSSR